METRFLVKVTATATENNKNFAGDVHTYIYGKDQELLKMEGTRYGQDFDNMNTYFLKKYGYKRACDAQKSPSYKNAQAEEFWNYSAEIVEVAY